MSILVFNAGSSSLKFGVFAAAAETWLQSGQFDWAGGDRRQAQCTLGCPDAGERRFVVPVPDDRAVVAGLGLCGFGLWRKRRQAQSVAIVPRGQGGSAF